MGHYIELPKLVHPDFAFPGRKPVGRVKIRQTGFSRGLVACLLFQGDFRDLVNGVAPSITGSPSFIINRKGRAVDFGRETDHYVLKYDGVINPSAPELTIMMGGHNWFDDNLNLNYINVDSPIVSNRTSGNAGWTYSVKNAGYNTNAKGQFTIQGLADYPSTSAFLNGRRHNVHGFTCKSGSSVRFFSNAAFQESISIGSISTGESNLWVGKKGNGGSPYGYEILTFLYVWERALSDAEYIKLSRSPYQILEPSIPISYFIPSAGGGTTINASLESISLTENASTVSLDKSITAALESILLTEYQSNTDLDKTVNGSVESISLSGLSASVQANIDTDISAAQESIQVSELAASISSGSSISAALESITVSGLASNVALDKNISAGIESISVSENAAQVTLGSNIPGSLEGITLTEHQAGVVLDVAVNAAQESITINQLAAMVGLATDINAVKENITLTESGATLTFDTSVNAAQEQVSLNTLNFILTSSALAPSQPGLEYTIPLSKLGYTIPISKIHFTFREED